MWQPGANCHSRCHTNSKSENYRRLHKKGRLRITGGLNVPAVISNQATDRIIKVYESMNFKLTFLDGPRMISCNDNRNPATEVLAVKVP